MRWNWLTLLGLVIVAGGCSGSAETPSQLKPGGSIVGNGGDIITCSRSANNHWDGDYTLDYYATYDPGVGTSNDPSGSYEELLDRVARLVRAKVPELSQSLDGFLALAESRDESQPRIWTGLTASPTNLKDEDIRELIKENCKETRDGIKVPNLTQMVDRLYKVDSNIPKVYYQYDHDKFQQLKRDRPLQAAYLMIHEWIWDFSDNAFISRRVNRLLQSKSTESMSSDELRRSIRALGITGDEGGYIGRSTGRTAKLQALFGDNPGCDFSHRAIYEFFPASGREVFTPRDGSRTFELKVPLEASEILGDKICGMALAFGYKGSVDLRLTRGARMAIDGSYSSSGLSEKILSATCVYDPETPRRCLNMTGELELLHIPHGFAGSRWSITVASGGGEAEMIVPYLLLVKMR